MKVTAYELSEQCRPDESLRKCEHFQGEGFTVIFESGAGQQFKQETKHLCKACVSSEAKVFNAEWPSRIRYLIANEETRVKSPSRRPSNRW